MLSAYIDAGYASQSNWRRSLCQFSTSETEYAAITQGAKAVLEFLQPQISGRTTDEFEDNQEAIMLAENPISAGRTKHIDVR